MSLEDRFIKLVRDMDAQILNLEKEVSDLRSKLRIANFPNEQATNCGRCGVYKHTPWRSDQSGYICVSCLAQEKDEEIRALEEKLTVQQNHLGRV